MKIEKTDQQEKVLRAMLCMTRQCWEQGMAAQCLLELGREEELSLVVYDMVRRQSSDGRLCNIENTPAVTDSAFCIPAVMDYARKTGDDACRKAAEKNIRFLREDAERAEDGTLYHMIHTKEIWADSAAYMPYALAKAGYAEEALVQMEGICRRLYDEKTGLYAHKWDEGQKDFIRADLWGIGNGWILTGLMRLYSEIPPSRARERAGLLYRMRSLLDALLSHETEDHVFHDVLDRPETFTESETGAMTAYTIYKCIGEGILDKAYAGRADRICDALKERVSDAGLVCQAAGSPDFLTPGTSVECQAHFLLMQHYRNGRRGFSKTISSGRNQPET